MQHSLTLYLSYSWYNKDEMIIAIMSKLVKQRKESIKSYSDGGRQDLVAQII